MKLAIGVPTPELSAFPDFAFNNFPQILFAAKKRFPDLELIVKSDSNVRTDRNRNNMLKEFLDDGADYVLWLDADMIYPVDIVETYLTASKDIIGCIYHKRSKPYDAVVYRYGSKPGKYKSVDVTKLPKEPVEVDGLGFGGLMVSRKVYGALGDEKWSHYGANFHIPLDVGDQNSHDLVFCEAAKRAGFKLYVHGAVRCGHLGVTMITTDDWVRENQVIEINHKPSIAVLCPSIDPDRTKQTLVQLEQRDGVDRNEVDVDYYCLFDEKRLGFNKMIQHGLDTIKADYYVYVAQDAFAGMDWLSIAFERLHNSGKELFAFNDGKWHGELASFGMMTREFAVKYWHTKYASHYMDTEISLIAMRDGVLAYDPESVLIEVDYNKHGVNKSDKWLFKRRKIELFPYNKELQDKFS